MATVYSRVIELQRKRILPFKFSKERLHKAGRQVRNHWYTQNNFTPPLVESVEPTGTYKVTDYPSEFVPEMDRIIVAYGKLVSEIWHQKNIQQEQSQLSTFSPAPIKRTRKRLPRRPEYSASSKC